jgi:hypothetical protein
LLSATRVALTLALLVGHRLALFFCRASDPEHVVKKLDGRLATGHDSRGEQVTPAELSALMQDVLDPPIERIGALSVNTFMKKTERRSLAAALNSLLASPTFAAWRQGATLDLTEWVAPRDGKPPIVVLSVAHLDDAPGRSSSRPGARKNG